MQFKVGKRRSENITAGCWGMLGKQLSPFHFCQCVLSSSADGRTGDVLSFICTSLSSLISVSPSYLIAVQL